jgi:hypothetical protein
MIAKLARQAGLLFSDSAPVGDAIFALVDTSLGSPNRESGQNRRDRAGFLPPVKSFFSNLH